MGANISNGELTIPKAAVLGVAEEVAEYVINRINVGEKSKSSPRNTLNRGKRIEALYCKFLQRKLRHLSEEERRLIEPVLLEYAHVSMTRKQTILRERIE